MIDFSKVEEEKQNAYFNRNLRKRVPYWAIALIAVFCILIGGSIGYIITSKIVTEEYEKKIDLAVETHWKYLDSCTKRDEASHEFILDLLEQNSSMYKTFSEVFVNGKYNGNPVVYTLEKYKDITSNVIEITDSYLMETPICIGTDILKVDDLRKQFEKKE